MADIILLEELNKVSSFSFEIDLGFSLIKFTSSYRKRFFNNIYTEYSINMLYTASELNLFFTFFNDTLKYGTKRFKANIFGELEEFDILKTPEYSRVEADLYNLTLNVLKIDTIASQELLELNNYLENFINSLDNIDCSVEANISASVDTLELFLCFHNFYNIITQDVNSYTERLSVGGL